jgi:hypothetical protein
MYVVAQEMMKKTHTYVEDHLHLLLLLHTIKHDLNMVMVMVNIIPRDPRLSADNHHHHHKHPAFDVVNVVVSSTMHPLVIVLNVVPDVKFKLFIFVLHTVLVCTTVCF